MRLLPLCTLGLLLGTCLLGSAQHVPTAAPLPQTTNPMPSMPPFTVSQKPPQPAPVNLAALQREAKELLDLSQSVQPDIQALSRGLMAKDLADRLKRIEKLSKQLRNEIAPLAK
jgi:hypothetical protein